MTDPIWIDCAACDGGGVIEGECICMEDTCCCAEPEPPVCLLCDGEGGRKVTPAALDTPPSPPA